jgi:nucleoside-diphosphate-sugar epimerase
MNKGKVTILGINGHLGRYGARAFHEAGYAVTGFGRSNRHPIAGVRFHQGNAKNFADLWEAVADADIVFNALNLPYDKWDKGRAEAQLANVVQAMGDSGKTLLYPGNIYNYAATDRHISPSTLQVPQTPRGAIRVRQEEVLSEASRAGKFQCIVLRAGDFFAADVSGGWFDQAMLMDAHRGKLYHMGQLELGHAWAYLPDLARAFVLLADQRDTLRTFENFHFRGHFVTNGELMSAIQKAWGKPLWIAPLPWILFQAMGLANGMLREIVKMRYLWNNPMELVDPRLEAMLGPDFGTPFDAAIAQAVQPLRLKLAA